MPKTVFFNDENDVSKVVGRVLMSEEKRIIHELLEYAKTGNFGKNMLDEESIEDCFNDDKYCTSCTAFKCHGNY